MQLPGKLHEEQTECGHYWSLPSFYFLYFSGCCCGVTDGSLVLVRITILMIKHKDQKQVGEERFYLAYTAKGRHSHRAGAEAETTERCCHWLSRPAFLQNPGRLSDRSPGTWFLVFLSSLLSGKPPKTVCIH